MLKNPAFLAWGIGSLGVTAMISSVTFIALFYLVEVVKLGPALAGTVLFISKLVDFVAYPAIGLLSDRTRSRWGRRRPFLLAGSIACGVTFVLAYNLPTAGSQWSTAVYAMVIYALYGLAIAVFFVPYMAQPADLTRLPADRNLLMAFRTVFLMLGTLTGSALTILLVEQFGGGHEGYRWMSVVVAVVIIISLLTTWHGTRRYGGATAPAASTGLLRGLVSLRRSRPFLVLVAAKFLQFFGMATGSATILFFVTVVMEKSGSWLAIYGIGIIVTSILAMRGWVLLIEWLGKRPVYMLSASGYALAMTTWLAAGPGESTLVFLLRSALVGISSGGFFVAGQSMLLDAIHDDELRHGEAREGTLMAIYAFVEKVAGALGPLVVGLLLAAFGFNSSAPSASESARLPLEICLVWIMVAVTALMIPLLSFYRLDERSLAGKAVGSS